MLSIFFYAFYFLLCFSSLYFLNRFRIALLFPLLFTAQFNVTSFLKVGVTISFFELNLIIVTIGVLFIQNIKRQSWLSFLYFRKQDGPWLIFLIFCLTSIPISILRVSTGNLHPDPYYQPAYYVRGLMSLNKFFFYLPCFYIIRSYLAQYYSDEQLKRSFLVAMAWSGLLPAVAVFVQFFALGSVFIHNNPSFAETFRMQLYAGARPVGLTNEASFFVYQLFFSAMALYYGWRAKFFNNRSFYLLTGFYIAAVIVSISRTGLLVFALFYFLVWIREFNIFSFAGFKRFLKYLPFIIIAIFAASLLNIGGFNLGQRILSAFQSEADISTIERYGVTKALFQLFLDKCIVLGTGIYNHQYYIKNYLPPEMSVLYYPKGVAPASFNFIFQLIVEFGLVVFLVFFYLIRRGIYMVQNDRFFKDWFLFLFIYSLSFQTLNFAVPFLIFFYPAKKAADSLLYSNNLQVK